MPTCVTYVTEKHFFLVKGTLTHLALCIIRGDDTTHLLTPISLFPTPTLSLSRASTVPHLHPYQPHLR